MTIAAGETRVAPDPLLTADACLAMSAPATRWLLAPAGMAWLGLLWLSGGDQTLALCIAPRPTLFDGLLANLAAGFHSIAPGRWSIEWALMIVAMMFPLLVPMVRHVAGHSFAARRERSVGLFVAGYATVWLTAAALSSVALVAARASLQTLHLAPWAGLICCAAAAAWQLSAAKVRAVNRCHGTVALRPWAPEADRDAIGFGMLHGTRCVRACLPVMVVPLVGGYGLAAMAAIAAILLAERARERPQYRLSAIALLLIGLVALPG
jgi:predicted metal-binding membrane protein